MRWVENVMRFIKTWDSYYEEPLEVDEYLERRKTERMYYWEEYFND